MSHLARLVITAICLASSTAILFAAPQEAEAEDAFAKAVAGLERREGLLPTYVDRNKGRVWLEIPVSAWSDPVELLYIEGLLSGLGSNPVGLDRGQLGETRVVRLRPLGGKLLIEHVNLGYRALSDNPLERRAVERSFASSVLWAGAIEARADSGEGLVDLTSFLVRDAHGVSATLQRAEQGSFQLDPERSAVDPDACLSFPDNLEFEAVLTWAGTDPGAHVRSTAPTAEAITLVQHHSFVRLPDDGYRPRSFDPRAGSFPIVFADYASGLDEPLVKRWIVRHRLEKTTPGAAPSTVKEPIVYYVDPGAPEAIREALIDGATWWADAFTRAGFIDAFAVELLPEDAHPLDVRYNVIQWVHRSTRGWSYGGGVIDPRTGEMIKGHVTLGSLRVRQDRLIFEGLGSAGRTGSGSADDPVELALARIRQLSAHEVGHTLGITHNFAASTYGRASVMDYPAPLVSESADGLDFSAAYAVGIGEWDAHAIRFAHAEFDDGADEATELDRILEEGRQQDLIFISDADARPAGAAHPLANLWDNGEEPVAELRRLASLRRRVLDRFGADNLAAGRPLALLHETLVPTYFMHRFQILAAAKVVGGLDYRYAVNGEIEAPTAVLDPGWQLDALDALLDLLEPGELDLREDLLTLLAPRPFGYGANRELMGGSTAPAFDSLGAASTLADMVLGQILQPERLTRVIDHHRRDPAQPRLGEVLDMVIDRVFVNAGVDADTEREAEIARTVQSVALDRLLWLARSEQTPRRLQYRIEGTIAGLGPKIAAAAVDPDFQRALIGRIERFASRRETTEDAGKGAPAAPPGQPIGSSAEGWDALLSGGALGCAWTQRDSGPRSTPFGDEYQGGEW